MEERQQIQEKFQDVDSENFHQNERIEELNASVKLLEAKMDHFQKMRNDLLNSRRDSENQANQRKEQRSLYDYFSNSCDQQLRQLG